MTDGATGSTGSRVANLAAAVALELTVRCREAVTARTGLSEVEAVALTAVRNVAQGQSIEVLRGLVGLSQPGCARLADRLVDRGLLRKTTDREDRRVVRVQLTARGERAVAQILSARADATESMLSGLSDTRRREFERGLAQVASGVVRRPVDADVFCRFCDPGACGHSQGRCPATEAARRLASPD